MPSAAVILKTLTAIATRWWRLSVAWHLALAVVVFALWRGWRPSKRVAGLLLVSPLISVSLLAWWSGNPFNTVVFAALAAGLGWHSATLGTDPIALGPKHLLIPGSLLVKFGWVYPHFLGSASWAYLAAAPLGLIPCPTLAVVGGILLVFNLLDSRVWAITVGVAALAYGLIGVFGLGVLLDVLLLPGGVYLLVLAARRDFVAEPRTFWLREAHQGDLPPLPRATAAHQNFGDGGTRSAPQTKRRDAA
jgi:hypothetical protein